MLETRYFTCENIGNSWVIDWNESCLIGDVVAEIVDFELSSMIRNYRPSTLVMNFGTVNGISSSVIGRLLKVQKELKRNRGQMRFISVSTTMRDIFRKLNLLDTYFVVAEDTDAALLESTHELDAEMQFRIEESE